MRHSLGVVPAGYAIFKPGSPMDAPPVCDARALQHTPELLTARAAANEAVRVQWEIGRCEAERTRKGSPMRADERRDALERVEENLSHRKVALIEDFPTDPSLLADEFVDALLDGGESPEELTGVAYIPPDDTAAMQRGEDFAIYVTLPPHDDGHDAERRERVVAEIVHQELTIFGIPHTWTGGKMLWVRGRGAEAQESQPVACESIEL
jgi:hypothetical protein